MFVAGQSVYTSMIFSILSFLVAIPSAVKVFNWTATLYKGRILLDTPMLYALGFIGLFTVGGLTGLFLASLAMDVHLSDTYFVIAHFHYIMWVPVCRRIWAAFISGGPKSAGVCIPKVGVKPRRACFSSAST